MLHHVRIWKSYATNRHNHLLRCSIFFDTEHVITNAKNLATSHQIKTLPKLQLFNIYPSPPTWPPLRWWRTAFKASCTAWSLETMRQSCVLHVCLCAFQGEWFHSWLVWFNFSPVQVQHMRSVTTHMYLEWNLQVQKRQYSALVDPIWGFANSQLCPYGLSLVKLCMLLALLPLWHYEWSRMLCCDGLQISDHL